MKQFMIDAMAAMMPFMRPLSIAGLIFVVMGFVLPLLSQGRAARWSGNLALAAGFFFLACEIAGRFLGFAPTILYADPMDRELYRNQWPFWTIGAALAMAGIIIRRISGRNTADLKTP